MIKKSLLGLVGLVLLFVLWPSPIDPIVYYPEPAVPFEGVLAENNTLRNAELLKLTSGFGPEDVAVDGEGRIYGGLQDGRIIRMLPDGSQEDFLMIEGGRPLGLAWDAAGNLIVADAFKGLLSVSPQAEVTVLTTSSNGVPFKFTDDVDIASDGKIYFSDASDIYGQHEFMFDLLEARPHGRMLMYDPVTRKTTTLLDRLYFANGIALSQNEDFVLVNETGRYRITRYWLSGEKAGTSDIFIDNLPGFPDGVSSNGEGVFYVAIPSPRNPVLDDAHGSPFFKKLLVKLPEWVQPGAIPYGMVLALDEGGAITKSYQDIGGQKITMVTSVEQVGDILYLGSLTAPQIGMLKVDNNN